jgi:hypothetical protein
MKLSNEYPSKFLRGQDIQDAPILITINGVAKEAVRNPQTSVDEMMPVLSFDNVVNGSIKPLSGVSYEPGVGHKLVLRKTLAKTLENLLETDETDEWTGSMLVLFASDAVVAGKQVQTIGARKPKQKTPASVNGAQSDKMKQKDAVPVAVKEQAAEDVPF